MDEAPKILEGQNAYREERKTSFVDGRNHIGRPYPDVCYLKNMKVMVCANFNQCRKILKDGDERVKIGRYTFCVECAKKRKP